MPTQKDKTDIIVALRRAQKHTISDDLLYVGIDIGKKSCVAGFVSTTLLARHGEFEQCPAISFDQSLEGFEKLINHLTYYVPLQQAFVLVEKTGHYHNKIVEFLRNQGVSVYIMHVKKRMSGMMKTDKRDALSLAIHLYDQLEKGAHVINKKDLVRKVIPATGAAAKLKGIMKHRQELMAESTQRRNKLTGIADELFPELTQIFHDPNSETALRYREQFSTCHAFATASMASLTTLRSKAFPSQTKLQKLRELAANSIGVQDANRKHGLVFEQRQLIRELKLIYANLKEIDKEVATILQDSREGQILLSIPGMGNTTAATILAAIGSIENFKSAGHLKSYFGWAPSQTQTGTSQDSSILTSGDAISKVV
jgi:transposase